MRIWFLKAAVQKIISVLPYAHKLNYVFQKYVTKGVFLTDALFEDKLSHYNKHITFYKRHRRYQNGSMNVLELGTGWFPIIPINCFLFGSSKIVTVDIKPLLQKGNVKATLKKFLDYEDLGKIDIPANKLTVLRKCYDQIDKEGVAATLKRMNIYAEIADARSLKVDSSSMDLIISNNTFEHIYPEILGNILQEFKRVARPGGVMSHFIDMTDHFAHLDKSITVYNFLQYSPGRWKVIDNAVQPQNRLRITNYREIYEQLAIDISEEQNSAGNLTELTNLKLDSQFERLPKDDLAICHSYMVSKM